MYCQHFHQNLWNTKIDTIPFSWSMLAKIRTSVFLGNRNIVRYCLSTVIVHLRYTVHTTQYYKISFYECPDIT